MHNNIELVYENKKLTLKNACIASRKKNIDYNFTFNLFFFFQNYELEVNSYRYLLDFNMTHLEIKRRHTVYMI